MLLFAENLHYFICAVHGAPLSMSTETDAGVRALVNGPGWRLAKSWDA